VRDFGTGTSRIPRSRGASLRLPLIAMLTNEFVISREIR
jgi:hypothetical protein